MINQRGPREPCLFVLLVQIYWKTTNTMRLPRNNKIYLFAIIIFTENNRVFWNAELDFAVENFFVNYLGNYRLIL